MRMSNRRSRGLSSASSLLSCARTARSMRRDRLATTAPFEGNASRKSASDTPAALQMSRIEMSSKHCSEESSISASTILPRASGGLASLFALLAMELSWAPLGPQSICSGARRQGPYVHRGGCDSTRCGVSFVGGDLEDEADDGRGFER